MAVMQRYAFALVVLFMFSLVFAFGAPPVFAQGFNFPSFNSTTNPVRNGNAVISGNMLRLTPASGGQVGSAWFNTQQVVTSGFTTTFQFKFTNPSTPPADGIAFVIQNSPAGTGAIGTGGGGIGYAGITKSLAVEFDTFQNASNNDPALNHIAVQSCGPFANTAIHDFSDSSCEVNGSLQSFSSFETPPNFSDGLVHTVVINYDPSSSDCEGAAINVYLDGFGTPVLTACLFTDLPTLLGLGEGGTTAFVGFTGATEAATDSELAHFENQDILNWSFSSHSGQTTDVILNFPTGTNVSATATYNCPSHTKPCTDAHAHSLKLTASKVTQPFSIVVSATTVDGVGSCTSGNPNDAHFDCRFVNHFGIPPGAGGPKTVPLCDDYDNGHCVYYRIENPPATSKYKGPIYWYIAWNDLAGLARCNLDNNPTATYQCTNEQMADDPSDPPHADANQFTRYITTYFNSNPNQVGLDPGMGGGSKNFNDVAAVFPLVVPNVNFILFAPQPNITIEKTDRLPIVFLLLQGSDLVTNATVNVAVLDSTGVRQPIAAPGSPPPTFGQFLGFYFLFLDTSQLAPGLYSLQIDSNQFAQQAIPFTVVPEDPD